MQRSLSFRARILLLVLGVGLVPLGLVGWWLTRSAARSGEELLRARLDESLDHAAADIGSHWTHQRSALLSLAETQTVQRTLAAGAAPSRDVPPELRQLFSALDLTVERVTIRDSADRALWSLERKPSTAQSNESLSGTPLTVRLGIYERVNGHRLGTLLASLNATSLLSALSNAPAVGGAVITILDPTTGVSLLSVPFDPKNLSVDRFQWAGEQWLAEHRSLGEPSADLVAAAPLGPFTQPFERAARRGLWLLVAAAMVALVVAALITQRMTRALSRLADAAEAVSAGDLSRKTETSRNDEFGRVARAFNSMTDSLGRTLKELSHREALAAVGEFAAELAHEVRNPLTSIRVDLQLVEERLPKDSPLREIQHGALAEIERLDGTVSGVLQLARSGQIELRPLDLREPVLAAEHAARPEFDLRGALIEIILPESPVFVRGDSAALRQLILNLLLNAAQALAPGCRAVLDVRVEGDQATVTLRDDGPGIPADTLARVREPFFSTKAEGTGLGLAIAERVVRAHGGAMEIESAPGAGTVVRVRLALALAVPPVEP